MVLLSSTLCLNSEVSSQCSSEVEHLNNSQKIISDVLFRKFFGGTLFIAFRANILDTLLKYIVNLRLQNENYTTSVDMIVLLHPQGFTETLVRK